MIFHQFLVQGIDPLLRWGMKCDTLFGRHFAHFVDPLVKVLQNALIALDSFFFKKSNNFAKKFNYLPAIQSIHSKYLTKYENTYG